MWMCEGVGEVGGGRIYKEGKRERDMTEGRGGKIQSDDNRV